MTKLEKLMKKNGLNKLQLNLQSGVNRPAFDLIIKNKNGFPLVNIKTMICLCKTLNCKMSDIIENDDELYKLVKEYEDTIYKK